VQWYHQYTTYARTQHRSIIIHDTTRSNSILYVHTASKQQAV
jgi:hypothetical protein